MCLGWLIRGLSGIVYSQGDEECLRRAAFVGMSDDMQKKRE